MNKTNRSRRKRRHEVVNLDVKESEWIKLEQNKVYECKDGKHHLKKECEPTKTKTNRVFWID